MSSEKPTEKLKFEGVDKVLGIIIPVYNESESLKQHFLILWQYLQTAGITAKILFVDDGSTDQTWALLEEISQQNQQVMAIRLSRNFGKENAIICGLDLLEADNYLVMDADLQYRPKYIGQMLEQLENQQVDIVHGVRSDVGRKPFLYRQASHLFYILLKGLTGQSFQEVSDFKLLRRKVVLTLRQMSEYHLFFRGMVEWSGYRTLEFPVQVAERDSGDSRFSLAKLIRLAGVAIVSSSTKPLLISLLMGIGTAIMTVVFLLLFIFKGNGLWGIASLITLLATGFSGILLLQGVYIAGIFKEAKDRPRYVISQKMGKYY